VELEARLARLEGQAARPVPAWVKERNRKSKRQPPGAREGHEPKHREQRPVDDEKDATLSCCPECDSKLGDPIEVRERVVEELVPARLHVTKYHIHRYWCTSCKRKVEAQPSGVLPGQRFGIHLMLLVCYLRTLGVTWEKERAYFQDSYGLKLSHGALVHMETVVAKALGKKYAALLQEVREAKSVHFDDTGWRIDGVGHWLWVLLSKGAAWYTVENTRSRRIVEENLGDLFDGVTVSDFFPSYRNLPYTQQKCLIHLLREIHRFEEKPDFVLDDEWKSVRMRTKRLVTEARNSRENGMPQDKREDLQLRLIARANAVGAMKLQNRYAKTLARLVGQYSEMLFTFVVEDDVAWENNAAERGLRPLVVNRKVSFGSRSPEGAQRLAVMHSIAQTARLRNESFFAFASGSLGHAGMPGT
jgi:transposase